MIYYFSGTGNSRRVADKLSKLLGQEMASMPDGSITPCDTLGFVFPVYAWGLPEVVETFIRRLSVMKPKYVWAVMTCGDDMGYADSILRKELQKVDINLDAVFSVQMPNTYVCLPGFDIDSDDVAERKVRETDEKIPSIVVTINDRKQIVDVVRGPMPFVKTYILRPLFNSTLVTDRFFRVTDECTHCGLCSRQCPLYNISMEEGEVKWHGNCTGCLRCYHQCPKRAIQFGQMTKNKGQKKAL